MGNFLRKIIFLFKKPKIVIVFGREKEKAKKTIVRVLDEYFKIGKEILVFEAGLENLEEFEFLTKNSSLPILVVTRLSDISNQGDLSLSLFDIQEIKKIAKIFLSRGCLVLNFDDQSVKTLAKEAYLKKISYGFETGADLRVTDININGEEINFKINYERDIVPFWFKNSAGQEAVCGVLPAICVGIAMGLNLVQISQVLREEHFLSK